jgi:hypothetical protein
MFLDNEVEYEVGHNREKHSWCLDRIHHFVLVELCVLFFERFREEEVYSDNQKAQKKNTDRYLIIMNFVVFIPVFIFVVTFHNTMEID